MRRNMICCLFLLLFITSTSFSAIIEKEFTFQNVEIQQNEEYHSITIPGLQSYGNPGEPSLPIFAYRLVLPSGEEISNVQIVSETWIPVAEDILPKPGREVYPISKKEEAVKIALSPIYESDDVFPATHMDGIRTDFLKGHGIGQMIFHPVRWNPKTGLLEQMTSLSVSIETSTTERSQEAINLLRSDSKTRNEIQSLSIDSEQLATYTSLDDLDELDTQFLVVCDETHANAWQSYADYKNRMGIKTEVLATNDIYSNYEGDDNQEKIRNAIIDYYDSGLEYVLLGGDVNYVPYRGFYATVGSEIDENIPADLYYAALDGNWNTDGDNHWGEASEDDLYQEISIGRAPVTSVAMIYTWTNKQIAYQQTPVVGEITNGLMVGEDLGWTSWGGDYKDEVRLGSTNYGYTTAGFPESWTVETLYDMNAVWTNSTLFNRLNSGVHYVNHLGHCNVTYGMKSVNSDINDFNLTNNGTNHSYYMLYTQGCYCGAFEQNSIMEKWNNITNGAFAVIANSRYGWGSGNNTDGPSQKYDREFFDAIFDEGIYRIGDVNRDSKHDNIYDINGSCMRWCYYEINLFGDPTVELYTDTIQELELSFPTVAILGEDGITVTGNSGIPFTVAVSHDNELLGVGNSYLSGEAFVELDLLEAGMLDVVVTAHNCVPVQVEIPTVAPDGPYPVINAVWISDDIETNRQNGQADFGETFNVGLEILNVGVSDSDTLTISISNADESLTFITETLETENIAAEAADTIYFEVFADIMVEDMEEAAFSITIANTEETWEQSAEITLHAPIMTFSVAAINDEEAGNGNHRLDPGETASITFEYKNEGSAPLLDAQFFLVEDDDYMSIASDPIYQTIPTDTTIYSTETITVTIDETCPNPSRVFFDMLLGLEGTEFQLAKTTYAEVGGIFNDVETGQVWNHYALNENNDDWHEDTFRNYSHDGTTSWKAGGEGGANYSEGSDICLEIPTFAIDSEVVLGFYHYMDAEISTTHTGQCYDGGRIESSEDGETWTPVMMPGYNYVTRGEGPVGEGVAVYSGNIEWVYDSVVLSSDADSLHVRFRFFSDNGVNEEGWYIDDISISATWGMESPCNLGGELNDESVYLAWEMPASIPEDAMPIGYVVYRDDELISNVLTDMNYTDDLSELPHGVYVYTVAGIYDEGPSAPSSPFEVYWGTTDAEDLGTVPSSWEIGQPYPNPFNPSFAVKVSLKESVPVSARLFNVLGQNVHSMSTNRLAAGYHTLSFNNMSLSSGIYFLTVKAGPEIQTFKVVMMK